MKEFIEKIILLYLLYTKNYIIIYIFIDTLNRYIENIIINDIQKLSYNNDIDYNNENNEINTTYLI
tara:strand:- start:1489 stop:1686 length:198 start_codon:yes stop_codon:yes gene_type:complete